jgi:hypothetical protein
VVVFANDEREVDEDEAASCLNAARRPLRGGDTERAVVVALSLGRKRAAGPAMAVVVG